MRVIFGAFIVMWNSLSISFAQPIRFGEECPVSKMSLARGLVCDVLKTVNTLKVSDSDTKIDSICLKLGRVSAILRRTQGAPRFQNSPIPPLDWKKRAEEIEGFCGTGKDQSLPRGLTRPDEYLRKDDGGLKQYLKERLSEHAKFISDNVDPVEAKCDLPVALKPDEDAECLN